MQNVQIEPSEIHHRRSSSLCKTWTHLLDVKDQDKLNALNADVEWSEKEQHSMAFDPTSLSALTPNTLQAPGGKQRFVLVGEKNKKEEKKVKVKVERSLVFDEEPTSDLGQQVGDFLAQQDAQM